MSIVQDDNAAQGHTEELAEFPFSAEQRQSLLALAEASIKHHLCFGRAHPLEPGDYPSDLLQHRGVFVTLNLEEKLRGCIGTLEAVRPLVCNVVRYAFLAAFSDPRFPELTAAELPDLEIQISIVGRPQSMQFVCEKDLLAQLRPGLDGLLLEEGAYCRATLLPSAWRSVQDQRQFFNLLKRKAGLPADYWSESLRIQRYRACCIS